MELLLEILFEVYAELMMLIVPEDKTASWWFKLCVGVIALAAMFGILALIVWGINLIFERGRMVGAVPLAFGIILSLAQIVLGIVFHNKHNA